MRNPVGYIRSGAVILTSATVATVGLGLTCSLVISDWVVEKLDTSRTAVPSLGSACREGSSVDCEIDFGDGRKRLPDQRRVEMELKKRVARRKPEWSRGRFYPTRRMSKKPRSACGVKVLI